MALLVARVMLLECLPVITEDLLEGVFIDSLPCGCHSARPYHGLAAKASRLCTLLSPSRPIASPRRDGQNKGVGKRKFLHARDKVLDRTDLHAYMFSCYYVYINLWRHRNMFLCAQLHIP